MNTLVMFLENGHILGCNDGNVPVRNHNCTTAGFDKSLDLLQGIGIQPVHGIGFSDTDRLAIRKIRDNRIDRPVPERQGGCIGLQEQRLWRVFYASLNHKWIKITSYRVYTEHLRFDKDTTGAAKRVQEDVPCSGHRQY